jgi:hypothetical protein
VDTQLQEVRVVEDAEVGAQVVEEAELDKPIRGSHVGFCMAVAAQCVFAVEQYHYWLARSAVELKPQDALRVDNHTAAAAEEADQVVLGVVVDWGQGGHEETQ